MMKWKHKSSEQDDVWSSLAVLDGVLSQFDCVSLDEGQGFQSGSWESAKADSGIGEDVYPLNGRHRASYINKGKHREEERLKMTTPVLLPLQLHNGKKVANASIPQDIVFPVYPSKHTFPHIQRKESENKKSVKSKKTKRKVLYYNEEGDLIAPIALVPYSHAPLFHRANSIPCIPSELDEPPCRECLLMGVPSDHLHRAASHLELFSSTSSRMQHSVSNNRYFDYWGMLKNRSRSAGDLTDAQEVVPYCTSIPSNPLHSEPAMDRRGWNGALPPPPHEAARQLSNYLPRKPKSRRSSRAVSHSSCESDVAGKSSNRKSQKNENEEPPPLPPRNHSSSFKPSVEAPVTDVAAQSMFLRSFQPIHKFRDMAEISAMSPSDIQGVNMLQANGSTQLAIKPNIYLPTPPIPIPDYSDSDNESMPSDISETRALALEGSEELHTVVTQDVANRRKNLQELATSALPPPSPFSDSVYSDDSLEGGTIDEIETKKSDSSFSHKTSAWSTASFDFIPGQMSTVPNGDNIFFLPVRNNDEDRQSTGANDNLERPCLHEEMEVETCTLSIKNKKKNGMRRHDTTEQASVVPKSDSRSMKPHTPSFKDASKTAVSSKTPSKPARKPLLKDVPKPHPKHAPKPLPKEAPKPLPKDVSKPLPKDVSKPLPNDAPKPLPKDAPRPLPKDSCKPPLNKSKLSQIEVSPSKTGKPSRSPPIKDNPELLEEALGKFDAIKKMLEEGLIEGLEESPPSFIPPPPPPLRNKKSPVMNPTSLEESSQVKPPLRPVKKKENPSTSSEQLRDNNKPSNPKQFKAYERWKQEPDQHESIYLTMNQAYDDKKQCPKHQDIDACPYTFEASTLPAKWATPANDSQKELKRSASFLLRKKITRTADGARCMLRGLWRKKQYSLNK